VFWVKLHLGKITNVHVLFQRGYQLSQLRERVISTTSWGKCNKLVSQ
jgi:hypothetical protein